MLGCDPQKEELQLEAAADYMSLQPGKYITYRLDSTVFTQQGRNVEIHSYQEKHVIDAEFLDNSGRKSYRVFRYQRDTAGKTSWTPIGTYMITPLPNSIEVIENNMRVVKLVTPVTNGYTWKGNQYLAENPYGTLYTFSNDDFMRYWEFFYKSTNGVFTYNQQDLTNVVTVVHVEETVKIDTVEVIANKANISKDAETAWIKGKATSATDTIFINAQVPSFGKEIMTIYNRTNAPLSLNGIAIPPMLAFTFQYSNGRWFYPNSLPVTNNRAVLPFNTYQAFIVGTATGDITVDASKIDTMKTKMVTVFNRSNKDAYTHFNAVVSSYKIPLGKGRMYQLHHKEWRLYDNKDELLMSDPYITDLPYTTTSYSVEKYAKGLGLVFQDLQLWEYQPNPGGTPYREGFGVRRSMIDHN